ncbi:MAG: hypothetical protein B6I36_01735 [Desulfobacteraceae bacterium 4572_35.1]|nr:MAG: hypothetical protein B6I36_01735 [Desulfobacteraceae bacterium 4572_35.1]
MVNSQLLKQFSQTATNVGTQIVVLDSVADAAAYVASQIDGTLLLPKFLSADKYNLKGALKQSGVEVVEENLREFAPEAEAGLTGVNFAIADTGTLVLESTAEDIRLATTLPPKQFAILDPEKIVANGLDAVTFLRQFHQRDERNFIAYITGPSRTADIERVLTVGVHGPKQLFVLIVAGISSDFMQM